ncbi:hypothetical protein P9598_gp53 [Escherichia phage vB_EcoD_Teewinot]|uniref:Uncharacterized protein n=1 Tax=Escherichia phage vB_EcoD_Teewinot TaxID=2894796 RepID=A0AAE8YUY2_9CAUD|nr:hypothetical protein P9598_gp53 [Escherichia phage vB_EcoD_Teewinot]UGO51173.1 hypothetical protein TEEEWINOT_53 [Escherichia phage vB_EcoD_Teewinot]
MPQFFEVLTHDIERGDVLRDIRDGQLWIVEHPTRLRMWWLWYRQVVHFRLNTQA